ncbi:apolipoprotein N-acyltransferase [Tateyamaria omphalii]|uniref:apolipoprotein N-acyltransferase n=1 Tax=Tateyamaria omphalii TaxID=299262 RepID=UPI0016768DD6|nr:apolipoprotein N-acyltransferase [Tateyamaria omphalii]GGX51646.1 apolipoprotein N-acyltransferase [Tateyamaria omphalii]
MNLSRAQVSAWPNWVLFLLGIAAGGVGALAHAPANFAPAIIVPLIAMFLLLRVVRRTLQAASIGLAVGVGYFGATLNWITEPFQVDAANTGWMAPFALVLLAILLGLFWSAALALANWCGGQAWILVFSLTGAEILRAYLFTGFPWATPPQALVDSLAGQLLALGGPHGVTFALLMALAAVVSAKRLWSQGVLMVGALVPVLIPPAGGQAPLTEHMVRLVQPNAPQNEKWDPARIPVFINRQIEYTAAGSVPDLIVWPETALPYLVETAQPAFDVIAEAARGAPVVLGIQRSDDGVYYNSLVMLDATAQVTQTYDKHHLVPFGEYMPLPGLFRSLGIRALADRADSGYGRGPGPVVMDMGPLGAALPLICYEAVFAHDVGGTSVRPTFLMQLTNDAWFGVRSGPQQHLAQAQMRAIEQGLPLIRAANTGISAVIDPRGRVTASLALNEAGFLDATLPEPGAPTLYSLTGDLPWIWLVLAGLIVSVLHRFRTRHTPIDAPVLGA